MKRPNKSFFSVEIKRSKRPRSHWSAEAEPRGRESTPALADESVFSKNGMQPNTGAPSWGGLLDGPVAEAEAVFAARPEPEASPPPAELPKTRVLPDLLSIESLEARIQGEFAQRSADWDFPKGPGRKKADQNPAEPKRPDRAEVAAPQARDLEEVRVVRARKPRSIAKVEARSAEPNDGPQALAAPHPAIGEPTGEQGRPGRVQTKDPSSADERRAKRRGQAVVLRAGERWKRRLPRVLW